jgi:hypothetical protein
MFCPFYHAFLLTFAFLSMMVCLISLIYLYICFCLGAHCTSICVLFHLSPCLCNCVLSVSLLTMQYVFMKKALGIDPFSTRYTGKNVRAILKDCVQSDIWGTVFANTTKHSLISSHSRNSFLIDHFPSYFLAYEKNFS